MYRMMLVEDEPEVLGAILETVDWTRYGFATPLGCRDGREAISALENGYAPDAVITDICMPFVDGLELTRRAIEMLPRVMVVILSGYDEFSYAQQALKLGVYDYVLKPVTPSALHALLEKLAGALDTLRLNDIEDSMGILLGHFLNRLILKPVSSEVVSENMRRHQITMNGPLFAAAVMDIDMPSSDTDSADDVSWAELMRYALYNIASELIDLPEQALVFQGVDGATQLIFSVTDTDALRRLAEAAVTPVCGAMRRHMSCPVSVGIGGVTPCLGEVYRSHRQAGAALAHRFFEGEGSVIYYGDLALQTGTEFHLSSHLSDFEDALRHFQKERASHVLSDIFAKLRDCHMPVNKCVLCCQRLIVVLHETVRQFGGQDEMKTLEGLWESMDFTSASTIGHLEKQMQELCGQILDMFETIQADAAAQYVSRAEAYILEHYGEPSLSLQSITEHLSVSVSYFSANFKAKTGSTFLEYLTRVRMNRARQLLALSDRRTYETAQAVGYLDPHYFSVAFKRYTGMSPREYREFSSQK